jgi:two-component system sensor histidine kinase/response regulator
MLVDSLVGVFADPGDQTAAVASATAQGISLAGLRVLLVEDNEINQQIAVELLEGVGAGVDVAANGQVAVDRLFGGSIPPPYDVVLMDLQMPVMDGHQATAKIRADARFDNLPILAMTAHATSEERDLCLANGMNGHISKPIDPALLFDTLANVARRPRAAAIAASKSHAPMPDVPSIDGLDCADGLRRVGGNVKLYVKLLREFASQQANVVKQIHAALDANDIDSAARLAHTLKGVAGNLGAGPVQVAAATVEGQLRDAAATGGRIAALENLAAALDPLLARIRETLTTDAAATAPVSAVDPTKTRAVAKQLAKLLDDFDTNAVTFIEQNEALMRPAFDAVTWDQLFRHVQGFAFADARILLDEAMTRLHGS